MKSREFAERIKRATPDERREITRGYVAWIFDGARAQGWYRAGPIILGASALIALDVAVLGNGSVLIYALCAGGALLGAWLTAIAFRREREWRRTHPFHVRGDDAQVR